MKVFTFQMDTTGRGVSEITANSLEEACLIFQGKKEPLKDENGKDLREDYNEEWDFNSPFLFGDYDVESVAEYLASEDEL